MNHTDPTRPRAAAWLRRLTVLSVLLVWPLIWVGGLVTTYDAGMAVPDWPNTYGYNLWLYPPSTWLTGPFDLFIEHGHRLLGSVVGLVAIGMVVTSIRGDSRRWVQTLMISILLAVISQGLLGGIRVVLSDRTIAMLHGCFGPVVFALCAVAVTVTGGSWRTRRLRQGLTERDVTPPGRFSLALAGLALALSYAQLVFGAQLRHVAPTTPASFFTLMVALHVMTAFAILLVSGFLWLLIRRCGDLTLSRSGSWLVGFVGLQIVLGTGTWVVNYGWPSFLRWFPTAKGFLLRAKGYWDSMIVTAHVAVGSLILASTAVVLVHLLRRRYLSRANDDTCASDGTADSEAKHDVAIA